MNRQKFKALRDSYRDIVMNAVLPEITERVTAEIERVCGSIEQMDMTLFDASLEWKSNCGTIVIDLFHSRITLLNSTALVCYVWINGAWVFTGVVEREGDKIKINKFYK